MLLIPKNTRTSLTTGNPAGDSTLTRGTYCNVYSRPNSRFVLKKLRHSLPEETAKKLKSYHDRYVEMLQPLVKVPDTEMRLREKNDGQFEVRILQENLESLPGSFLVQLLKNTEDANIRRDLFASYLIRTLNFSANAEACWGEEGKLVGLDSTLVNWWISSKGEWQFIDTMLPILKNGNCQFDIDLMIAGANPKVQARLMFMAIPWVKSIRKFVGRSFFEPPAMLRHALTTALWHAPKLKDEFWHVAQEVISGIKDDALRKKCEKAIYGIGMRIYPHRLRFLIWMNGPLL